MKKLANAVAFLICFLIIFMLLEKCLFNYNSVSTTWNKVYDTEYDMDILFMGNSHVYRSIDADVLSQASGRNVDILGSPSATMEVVTENLKVVLENNKPEVVILECYAPSAEVKEKLQGPSIGYLMQNFDGVENSTEKIQAIGNTFKWTEVMSGMFQLVRPTNMWERWTNYDNRKEYSSDENGYLAIKTYAQINCDISDFFKAYTQNEKKKDITEYNKESLIEFLELTEQENIEVWLLKSPTLFYNRGYMYTIEEIAKEYPHVKFVDDLHLHYQEFEFDNYDFYDTGHLSRDGAEKITYYYGNLMSERLGIQMDWDNVFGYKSEEIIKDENSITYRMNNYLENCLYSFKVTADGNIIEETDFSESNEYILVPEEGVNYRIYCTMIPREDLELGTESENKIYLEFMTQNTCVIE